MAIYHTAPLGQKEIALKKIGSAIMIILIVVLSASLLASLTNGFTDWNIAQALGIKKEVPDVSEETPEPTETPTVPEKPEEPTVPTEPEEPLPSDKLLLTYKITEDKPYLYNPNFNLYYYRTNFSTDEFIVPNGSHGETITIYFNEVPYECFFNAVNDIIRWRYFSHDENNLFFEISLNTASNLVGICATSIGDFSFYIDPETREII